MCIVTDSATIPTTANSINSNTVTINKGLGIPTLASAPSAPSNQVTGNTITFTANIIGGSSPYTYNYLVFNTITNNIIADQVYSGVALTSNTYVYTIPSGLIGNTIAGNVIVTDSSFNDIYYVSSIITNSLFAGGTTQPFLNPSNTLLYVTNDQPSPNGAIVVINTITDAVVNVIGGLMHHLWGYSITDCSM